MLCFIYDISQRLLNSFHEFIITVLLQVVWLHHYPAFCIRSCEDQPSRNKSTLYKWCFSFQFIGNVRVRGEFLQVEASDFLRYNGHSSGVLGAFFFFLSALLLEYLRIYLVLIDNLLPS